MTLLSFVLLLLAPCVLLPGLIVALLYGLQGESGNGASKMKTTLKGLRADVGEFDVDARDQAWRRENWDGPESYVADRIAESSHEVMVLTPYAEASVVVMREEGGKENRRCSLCLN